MKVKHLTKIYNILNDIDKKIDVLLNDKPKIIETEAEWESNIEQQEIKAQKYDVLNLSELHFSNTINEHKSIYACPFHADGSPLTLMVNTSDKSYYCFTCKASGNIS